MFQNKNIAFFRKMGHIATVALEDRSTNKADQYTSICLSEVIAEIRRNNVNWRINLHHETSTHKGQQTAEFSTSNNIQ